ncbi:hypothetical protein R0J87_25030, partial [Halomonas sp. SIMBA_159]
IDSLAAITLVQRLNHALNMHDVSAVGVTQPVTLAFLYQHATPDAMCRALSAASSEPLDQQSEQEVADVSN